MDQTLPRRGKAIKGTIKQKMARQDSKEGGNHLEQPCTLFGYKDFCGSTVLGTPESVGMNRQTDWQAQQKSQLVCSLARQRC